jgi:hypothetical protein
MGQGGSRLVTAVALPSRHFSTTADRWEEPVASLLLTKAEMEAIRFAADMVDTARGGAEEEATPA